MRFWLSELAGWALVLLGLWMFHGVYELLLSHYIWEGGIFSIAGIFVFRGGIQLLKVAVAARACTLAQQRLYPAPPAPEGSRLARAVTEPRLASRGS